LSALTCLTIVLLTTKAAPMWALVLLKLFHSIMFPTIHRDTFKSICSSADVTDFRRASGRAGPHEDYQSSLCVP
jgi:fucose permease